MKDKHTVGGKWPEIAVNKPFIIVIRFDSDYKRCPPDAVEMLEFVIYDGNVYAKCMNCY